MFNLKKSFIILTILSFNIKSSNNLILNVFKSDIKINKDRSVDIVENYIFTFYSNKHGIKRTFPVYYKSKYNNDYKIDFKLNSVLRDGKPEKYSLQDYYNSKLIVIGDPKKLISGKHSYKLDYKVDRIVATFNYKDSKQFYPYDELYFQAIPAQHDFDIEKAVIKVQIPENINPESIKFQAYFGTENPISKNYTASIEKNIIKFKLNKLLNAGEKFSIVVGWPSGYIDKLTILDKIKYFLKDNIYIIILIIGLIILLVYYFIELRRIKSKIIKKPIIPLFYPPKDFTASAVGYIYNYNFSNKLFTAEIISMAVNNLIKIDYKKYFFSSSYTLIKNKEEGKNILDIHKELLSILFYKKDKIELSKKNSYIIEKAINKLNSYLRSKYNSKYFDYHLEVNLKASILGFVFIFISTYFNITFITIFFALIYIFFVFLFSNLIKNYTQEGQEILEKIKGFKRFLSIAESEKLKLLYGPEQNIELFEKYLPYAISLNVEKEWNKKFNSIFEKIKDYNPKWINSSIFVLNHIRFSYNLTNIINSSVSSSFYSNFITPGTISGFESKGKSGESGGGSISSW